MITGRRIPIARPRLGEREADAARRVILSGWVTQGPEVAAFEQEFGAFISAPHACAVSSCTTAMHLGLRALGVGPGDEVITVSHSFIATANAIRYCGATPVFVDVQDGTFNIDPDLIAGAISPRTRAIVCVHQLGMPCDLSRVLDIARRHGLRVLEDAACAAGSEIELGGRWERIGRPAADVACFSFHPRKLLTCGDGGMITTANPEWDAAFRRWRQHGMSTPDYARHQAPQVVFEAYHELGYNYRLTDVQAAIGREQLKRLPETIARRRQIAARYAELLADIPDVTPPFEPSWARTNWQSYCVRLHGRLGQRQVMQRLLDEGVSTRRAVMCAHREPAYSDASAARIVSNLAKSEHTQDHAILLPLYHDLTDDDLGYVTAALRRACVS